MREISIDYNNGAPPQTEWIPDDQIESVKREAKEHGATVEDLGPVSWQRQLARMESPEL